MKEFLVIRNNANWTRSASEDIIYIHAAGNYSDIMLSLGEKVTVTMQIGEIFEEIERQLDYTVEDFVAVGRSLIINRKHLNHINLSTKELVLTDGISTFFTLKVDKEPLKRLKKLVENEKESK